VGGIGGVGGGGGGGVGGGGGGKGGSGGGGGGGKGGGGGGHCASPDPSVALSEAETSVTLTSCAEHISSATARTRIMFLKFIFTLLIDLLFF